MGDQMSRRKKKHHSHRADLEYFEMALTLNGKAQEEQQRKKWSMHDVKQIQPLTPMQQDMFHAWYNKYNICAHGSAGTGKTFLAIYLALQSLLQQETNRILIVRSVVPTRDVGHLPGTLEEKTSLYELSYHDIFWELMGRSSTYGDMKAAGLVEFATTSFIRGITWDNTTVIVYESQNMTFHEIDSIMTRLGDNSRVIFTGDLVQTDLTKRGEQNGMNRFMDVIGNMDSFADVKFTHQDIIRSDFVKSWIVASEQAA